MCERGCVWVQVRVNVCVWVRVRVVSRADTRAHRKTTYKEKKIRIHGLLRKFVFIFLILRNFFSLKFLKRFQTPWTKFIALAQWPSVVKHHRTARSGVVPQLSSVIL